MVSRGFHRLCISGKSFQSVATRLFSEATGDAAIDWSLGRGCCNAEPTFSLLDYFSSLSQPLPWMQSYWEAFLLQQLLRPSCVLRIGSPMAGVASTWKQHCRLLIAHTLQCGAVGHHHYSHCLKNEATGWCVKAAGTTHNRGRIRMQVFSCKSFFCRPVTIRGDNFPVLFVPTRMVYYDLDSRRSEYSLKKHIEIILSTCCFHN